MQFVRYNDTRLGLLTDAGAGVIDLTDPLGIVSDDPLQTYLRGDFDASRYADEPADHALEEVRLDAPIRRPGKVVAAPGNYRKHVREAMDDPEMPLEEFYSIEDWGYFLKAPSSVIGPEDTIELPFTDRRCDYEIELAFVLGEDVKDVTAEEILETVFGYTILLDISARGEQDRSNRKSYDTFTVIGPSIVTADEIDDPQDLRMTLTLNGEVRQDETTAEMIYSCAEFAQYASIGTTIEAGDVITTGTPVGVGELADGDELEAAIDGLGSMTLDVTERDVRYADNVP